MIYYKFDKDELLWKKNWSKTWMTLAVVLLLITSSFLIGRYVKFKTLDEFEKEVIVFNYQAEKNKFTEEKLVNEIKRLNFRFPHIVMAQAMVESGHFKDPIFVENHNLFGMKQAVKRINFASGTQLGHAYYDDWTESVYDYGFYQCRYLSDIKTEDEYFNYLSRVYAESGQRYVTMLKSIIKTKKLKEKFING